MNILRAPKSVRNVLKSSLKRPQVSSKLIEAETSYSTPNGLLSTTPLQSPPLEKPLLAARRKAAQTRALAGVGEGLENRRLVKSVQDILSEASGV